MHWTRTGRGRKKYAKPKKRRTPRYAPYRSALEKRIAGAINDAFKYEPKDFKVRYNVPHIYTPDFVNPEYPAVYIEVKGYFRTASEASKYMHIKESNPEVEIIFIFGNSFKKAHPNCRPRKDGSVLTLEEWCNKHEFLFYEEKHLPPELINGKITPGWIKQERKKRGFTC